MKRCYHCRETKSYAEFGTNRGRKDGLADACRKCAKAISTAYFKTPKGRAALTRAQNRWRKTEHGKASTDRSAKRRRKLLHDKAVAGEKPYAARCKRWRERNPQAWKTADTRQKNKYRRADLGKYSSEMQRLATQANKKGLALDHIIPISGKEVCGLNVPWNTQLIEIMQNKYKYNWFDHDIYQAWRKNPTKPLLKP